ncbi:DUF4118 domain-containing protein [Photobacterium sp. WH77]|uniref:sensor histidine kinase n=1 Tax=Photobacterium TaxID=657 RepID=UPI001C471C5D|nr:MULTISPECIES: DUF4118 domain-containing protein [Photobacterium]MBV7261353.1 DUF4118 domain-containing protein [Photobacterium sp. WH24]MCG2836252.1 DUF4118 domain-containing protein [Photobacterium sp. WH77]MCG2843611.1 DUF4118 domain-containing protein [Photobacterium sp. WH80]
MFAHWRNSYFLFSFMVLASALLASWLIDLALGSTIAVLLILQLAVVVVALQCTARFAYGFAVIEALSFNFLFTTPRYSLQMFHAEDIINLVVFIIVALTTSQLAEHYRRQQDELKKAKLRNSILLSVSHDLRTPLATIIGTLTTLNEYMPKLSEGEKSELLNSATAESHRLHQYIENLLQATKLQHGALKITRNDESLADIVHQAILRLPEARNRFRVQVQGQLSRILVSGVLIEQALFNVLDNALRFSPKHQSVVVTLFQESAYIVIDIQDKGVGIKSDEAARIFDLFYSSATKKTADSGSGLGLAVAKGIITAHQGLIESVPVSEGCLIRIRLPIDQPSSSPQGEKS